MKPIELEHNEVREFYGDLTEEGGHQRSTVLLNMFKTCRAS